MNWTNLDEIKGLKSNLHATFDSTHGKEAMKFMQQLGGWYPTEFDSMETNAIIARDANRRLLGTIRTVLELSPEQIVALAQTKEL